MAIDLLAEDELRVADRDDFNLLHHLPDDHADVLVVDAHALQPVDLLDLVDQICLQRVLAEDRQHVVRIGLPLTERLASLHGVAVPDQKVLAHGHRMLVLVPEGVFDREHALALRDAAEVHDTVDLGQHRGIPGPARLEQLADARQTAGDVTGLDALLEQLGQRAAGLDLITLRDVQIGGARQIVDSLMSVLGLHDESRLQGLRRKLGDLLLDLAGILVDLLAQRGAQHDVVEPHRAAHLGDDGLGERVEVRHGFVLGDDLLGPHHQFGAVADVDAARLSGDQHLGADAVHVADLGGIDAIAVATHQRVPGQHLLPFDRHEFVFGVERELLQHAIDDQVSLAREQPVAAVQFHDVAVDLPDHARIRQVHPILLADPGRCAADVKGLHGQLRARLPDGLSGDDAHRFADLDGTVRGEIASVTLAADAVLGLAGQHRADAHGLDADLLDVLRELVGDFLVEVDDDRAGDRMLDPVQGEAAGDAVAQRLDDVLTVLDRLPVDAVDGAAIILAHHHVLGDIDQAAGQVAGVGRLERRVGQPLAGAVGRDEELDHGQAFLEVASDGQLDDLARRVGHQPPHSGELADLLPAPAGAGRLHHVHGVEALPVRLQLGHQLVGDVVVGGAPDLDDAVVALLVGDVALQVLVVDLLDLVAGAIDELGLRSRHQDVLHADGRPELRRVVESQLLDGIQRLHGHVRSVVAVAVGDQPAQFSVVELLVDELHLVGKVLVQEDPPGRGVHVLVVQLELDPGVVVDRARVHRPQHLRGGGEVLSLAGDAVTRSGQIGDAQDHVLRRHHDRRSVGRVEQVLAGQHQRPALDLRVGRERHMHGHLVAVEIGVECRAHQRVQLDRLAFHQHRLEGLDSQPVQGGRPVQEDRVLADDLLQDRPHLWSLLLHQRLGLLDVVDDVVLHQLLHDEGLEQLQRHLGGQTALVQLEFGANHDHGPAGVVHALAQQVLPEAALLAAQHVGQGLQRPVRGALDDPLLLRVVEQRVHRFLQHALLVADDDVGGVQGQEALEAVVAVDHASVEVVQVGGREAAAVQLHHRPQLRRDHRNDVEHHPFGIVA